MAQHRAAETPPSGTLRAALVLVVVAALVATAAIGWTILRPSSTGGAPTTAPAGAGAAASSAATPSPAVPSESSAPATREPATARTDAPAASANATPATTSPDSVPATTAASSNTPASPLATPTGARAIQQPNCGAKPSLRVAATARIMPLLKLVAAGACITLDGQTSETVSGATLLGQHRVDAWVPDSRSFALAAGAQTASTARSVASSPIVMAAAPATAASLRKQGANSWARLLATHGTLGGFPVSIQPDQSSVAVTISNELTAMASQSAKDPYLGLGGAAAAITAVKKLTPQQLSTPIPAGQVRIAERRMIDGDIGTVVPAKEGEPALDYPWVMPTQPTTPQAATAVTRLVAALFGTAGRQARKQLGFDEPGVTHVDLGAGSPSVILPPVDLASAPAQFMMSSTASLKTGHALALLDISGSMGDPAASGQTPMESLRASVPIMISSLVQSTEVGVWEFGYRLDGDKDYRELLPTAALSTNRKPLLQTVATIKAQRSGTALYSSVLDGYRYTLDHYDASKTNMLLIFTDGKNQDAPGGLDLPTLTAQLAAVQDKAKPISVVFFGFGDADIATMRQIVKSVQHGIVVKIDKPQQILGAFIDAMAKTTVFAG